MRRVTIKGDRTAGYETCIDGLDISDQLHGLQLVLGGGQPPVVTVSTGAGRVEFEGDATVIVEDPEAEKRAILAFLDNIDPVGLEEAMLGGDMGSSPAQMALSTLRRLAIESYGG